MLKKDIRKLFREKRKALSEKERVKMDDLMLINFQSAEFPFIHSLLSYWPIEENNEPDTHLFNGFMKFKNPELRVCYPVADLTLQTMTAFVTDIDTPFIRNEWNIYEPQTEEMIDAEELDMIFIPLLAFDRQGYRVGYGKGFYDKYLAGCREDCLKIGFSYFEPVSHIDDRHEFDVPLNLCITPQNVYVF